MPVMKLIFDWTDSDYHENIFFFEYSDGSDKKQWNSDSKDLLNKVFRRRIIIKYRKTERRKYTKLKREFSFHCSR